MKEYTDEFDIESFISRCVKELELSTIVGKKAKEIMKRAAVLECCVAIVTP